MAAGAAQTYAASYDLRTVGKVTSVKNQNPYGTCWAFATFGSLESYLLPNEARDFSEHNLATQSGFDIAWDAGGNNFMSTAYLSRWGGPLNEVDDPYPGSNVHLPNNNAYTIQKHTQDVLFLPERTSSTNNDNIKWGLTTYGGLDVSIYWDNRYYSSSPATYYNPSTTSANHEVTLVGWDDNYAATNFHGTASPRQAMVHLLRRIAGERHGATVGTSTSPTTTLRFRQRLRILPSLIPTTLQCTSTIHLAILVALAMAQQPRGEQMFLLPIPALPPSQL